MNQHEIDLLTITASDARGLLDAKRITSTQLVQLCLDQIQRHNKAGLKLNAVLSTAPQEDLMLKASILDDERARGLIRSPLHGLPILLKDCISTHPALGMNTSAGCWALTSSRPSKSAVVIDRIVEAGLIPIAKSSLTEFNNWKGSGMHDGWSAVGGQTQSAFVAGGVIPSDRPMGHSTPGGSSSGSAVGVAAGFSLLSLGQETDGSLISPASRAALYALKPTIGSVTMDGVISVTSAFDTLGAMARSVDDVATLTETILDPLAKAKLPKDGYKSYLSRNWKGLKIGFLDPEVWKLPESLCEPNESALSQMKQAYSNAIAEIKACGASIVYPLELMSPPWTEMGAIMTYEFKIQIEKYLGDLESSEVRSLAELIDWNKAHADIELPSDHPDQSRLIESLQSRTTPEQNAHNRDYVRKVGEKVSAVMSGTQLDAILILSDSPITSIAAVAGWPAGTMPLGTLDLNGRPFGVTAIARANDEGRLLSVMSAWEATFPKPEPSKLFHNDGQRGKPAL